MHQVCTVEIRKKKRNTKPHIKAKNVNKNPANYGQRMNCSKIDGSAERVVLIRGLVPFCFKNSISCFPWSLWFDRKKNWSLQCFNKKGLFSKSKQEDPFHTNSGN